MTDHTLTVVFPNSFSHQEVIDAMNEIVRTKGVSLRKRRFEQKNGETFDMVDFKITDGVNLKQVIDELSSRHVTKPTIL